MCGVFGFVNCGDPYQRKLLAYMSRSRGTEGTGAVWINSKNKWKMEIVGKDFANVLLGKSQIPWGSKVLIGHLRRSSPGLFTNGGQHDKNTHPFRRGNIILAHNGYIRNWMDLEKTRCKNRDHYVDSDVLASMVNEHGADALADVNGKATVWFMDVRDTSKFYIWCWKQDLAISCGKGCMAFASEPQWLTACGFKDAKMMDKDCGQLLEVNTKTGVVEVAQEIKASDDEPPPQAAYSRGIGPYGEAWRRGTTVYPANGGAAYIKGGVESASVDPDKPTKTLAEMNAAAQQMTLPPSKTDDIVDAVVEEVDTEGDVVDQTYNDDPYPPWVPAMILDNRGTTVCAGCGAACMKGSCHICGCGSTYTTFMKREGGWYACEACGAIFSNKIGKCPRDDGEIKRVIGEAKVIEEFAMAYYIQDVEWCRKMAEGLSAEDDALITAAMELNWTQA